MNMTADSAEFAGTAVASDDWSLSMPLRIEMYLLSSNSQGVTIAISPELLNTSPTIGKIPKTPFRRAS